MKSFRAAVPKEFEVRTGKLYFMDEPYDEEKYVAWAINNLSDDQRSVMASLALAGYQFKFLEPQGYTDLDGAQNGYHGDGGQWYVRTTAEGVVAVRPTLPELINLASVHQAKQFKYENLGGAR